MRKKLAIPLREMKVEFEKSKLKNAK